MKPVNRETRTRKNIWIDDQLYRKVSVEAAKNEVDKGKVIEEALKQYFVSEDR